MVVFVVVVVGGGGGGGGGVVVGGGGGGRRRRHQAASSPWDFASWLASWWWHRTPSPCLVIVFQARQVWWMLGPRFRLHGAWHSWRMNCKFFLWGRWERAAVRTGRSSLNLPHANRHLVIGASSNRYLKTSHSLSKIRMTPSQSSPCPLWPLSLVCHLLVWPVRYNVYT